MLELTIYMIVSALILEGLVLFTREHSVHERIMNDLTFAVANDEPLGFVLMLLGYICVVACMPLTIYTILSKDL